MSAHITDIDDLLGREKRVIWPPPEPETSLVEMRDEPAFSPSPPPPPIMSPSPVPPAPVPQVPGIYRERTEGRVSAVYP